MITGDNPITAAAIAAEAGIDDFIGQARPEDKLEAIRKYQREGHLVAMIGDGTNDAPALAQADVAVAMNAGTQAAREAANMVDLDSNPAKLLDIVEIGKQILITRGALTTFSVANDVSKYFAILPAIFAAAVSHAEHPEHHAAGHTHERGAVGDHLQCHHHSAAHSPGAEGRKVSADDGGCASPSQPADLRSGRIDCAFHRHQDDRYHGRNAAPGVRKMYDIIKEVKPAVLLFLVFSLLTGLVYPLVITGIVQIDDA